SMTCFSCSVSCQRIGIGLRASTRRRIGIVILDGHDRKESEATSRRAPDSAGKRWARGHGRVKLGSIVDAAWNACDPSWLATSASNRKRPQASPGAVLFTLFDGTRSTATAQEHRLPAPFPLRQATLPAVGPTPTAA